MITNPVSPRTRSRIPRLGWVADLLGGRSTGGRITHVSELPPRLLNDIGLSPDRIELTLRHRR